MKISPTSNKLLVWKGQKAKIKINQNLNQRMKTIVRRKTGPARRDDLPCSKVKLYGNAKHWRYYNKEGSNLKDISIAALSSLAFAGFFRYNELCNIAPNHIEFHSQYI